MSEGFDQVPQPKRPQEDQEPQPEAVESHEPNAADTAEQGRTSEQQREQPPSADESRQNFERIKAQDAEPEKKEGRYKSLINDIDGRERHLTSSVGREQEKTSAARARLDLPTESADTHAVRSATKELADLKSLRGEVVTEMYKGKETQESQERDRALREGSREVSEAVTQFASEIQHRERDGMDTFLDERAFSSIRSGAVALQTFSEGKGKVDPDELASGLASLNSGLEQMGQNRRSGPINESEQSLSRLGYASRSLYEATGKLSKGFREGDEQASFAARRLMQTSERVYGFAGRLRSALYRR